MSDQHSLFYQFLVNNCSSIMEDSLSYYKSNLIYYAPQRVRSNHLHRQPPPCLCQHLLLSGRGLCFLLVRRDLRILLQFGVVGVTHPVRPPDAGGQRQEQVDIRG